MRGNYSPLSGPGDGKERVRRTVSSNEPSVDVVIRRSFTLTQVTGAPKASTKSRSMA
jgi:hypothetical protein